jgi:NAD(P)-dependent dehydrogenase (short-subunit alcohol dehydrogenase family)
MSRRTWLITGVSSGLGREMTRQLLRRGDRVAGTTRALDALGEFRGAYGDRFWHAPLDVTDTAEVRTTVDRAFSDLGRIDAVINNAGYGLFGAAEELTDEQIDHHLATNLTGSIQVARAALPHLRAQGGGRIVQVSSYGGQAANAGGSLYNAGKFGIEGFMEALAKEVAPFGIGVTIVEPGGTDTNFRQRAVLGDPLPAYDNTLAAAVRGLAARRPSPGAPAKVAAMIIEAAEAEPAPARVVLGSDSYRFVYEALTQRLAGIEGQREKAALTDID